MLRLLRFRVHDGASTGPDVSGDGRFVVFRSEAGNLAGDASQGGVMVADMAQARLWGVGERDEVDQNPLMPERVRISGDGRFVFFRSNRRLTEDDSDDVEDVYRPRRNGKQRRLAALLNCATPMLSADAASWCSSPTRAIWYPAVFPGNATSTGQVGKSCRLRNATPGTSRAAWLGALDVRAVRWQ